jgi:hypothetical protein
MILLAEAADRDTGSCYPGITSLARLMRTSERNVQYRLKELRDSGELTVLRQRSPYGTNVYVLNPSLLGDEGEFVSSKPTTRKDEAHFTPTDGPSTKYASPPSTKHTSPKPSVEPSVLTTRDKSLVVSEFATWYQDYPRKEKRLDAEKAWIKLTDDERRMAAEKLPLFLPYYKHKRDLGEAHFIPLPTTWLNGKRWLDDPPKIERIVPRATRGGATVDFAELGRQKMNGRHEPAGNVVDVEGRVR